MAKKYQVRFNLGAGKNYQKWKVTSPDGGVQYLEPSEISLLMKNCKLVNHKGAAQKIYEGANKTVCAWIEAEEVKVINIDLAESVLELMDATLPISYNPRVSPNWILDGENADKEKVSEIVTHDRKVYKVLTGEI